MLRPIPRQKGQTKQLLKREKEKKSGKKATLNNGDSRRENEAEEEKEDIPEEDSPRKQNPQQNTQYNATSVRIIYGPPSLNAQLNNLSEEEKQGFDGIYTAYRARVA